MKATKINGIEYSPFGDPEGAKNCTPNSVRWRQQGKIPAGHRYRDRNLLYTLDEVEEIRQFANRVEDIDGQ